MTSTQSCGCELPALDGVYGLVDATCEAIVEVDAGGGVFGAYPHESALFAARACGATSASALLSAGLVEHVAQQVNRARTDGRVVVEEVRGAGLRVRVVARETSAVVFLRALQEDSFWRLFETAPVALGLLFDKSSIADGSTRFNKRFTDVFGWAAEDVPTAAHWWPIAYPDPVYRETLRDEWYRRVQTAMKKGTAVVPLDANVTCKDGTTREVQFYATDLGDCRLVVFVDLTEHNRTRRELREAHENVRALSELLPVCAWCKRMRDDGGYWQAVEHFISQRTGATITHGICPDCRDTHFRRNDSTG